MNIAYLIYQAERPKSALERREADVHAGELAAAVARLGRSLRHAVTGGPNAGWGSQAPAIETITCAVPRPLGQVQSLIETGGGPLRTHL